MFWIRNTPFTGPPSLQMRAQLRYRIEMKQLTHISSGIQSVAKLILFLFLALASLASDTSPFASIAGAWTVRFGNGVGRVYQITPDGSYTCIDVEGRSEGKVLTENGQFIIHCIDGRIQRLTKLADTLLKVEAFADADAYAQGRVRTTGSGTLEKPAPVAAATPSPAPSVPPPMPAAPGPIIQSLEEILAGVDTTKPLKPYDRVDFDLIRQMDNELRGNEGREIEIEIQPARAPSRNTETQFRWQLAPVKSFTPALTVTVYRDDVATAVAIVPGKPAILRGVIQRCTVGYSSGPMLYLTIQESTLKLKDGTPASPVITAPSVRTAASPNSAPAATQPPDHPATSISLKAGWDGPMQGGSKTLEDLAFVLNGFAKADPNPPFEDVEIYNGVKYLMPLNEAVGVLGIKGRLPAMKKVIVPGFPRESLNYTSVDGLFEGHYNRMDIVTDMANQVVTLQFVDEHPKDTSFVSVLLKGNWLTYNFVGYRVKALTTLSVDYSLEAYDTRQSRWWRGKPEYLARYYPTSPTVRVFTYLMDRHQVGKPDKRLEETMWCVPRPFASVMLHCASKVQR